MTISEKLQGVFLPNSSLEVQFSCPNTPEALDRVVTEVAQFYGKFLTRELHEGPVFKILREKGMWLTSLDSDFKFPSKEKIDGFVQSAIRHLKKGASSSDCELNLGTNYAFEQGPLEAASEEQLKGYLHLLCDLVPQKTNANLAIAEGEIKLEMELEGPPF